MKVTVELTPAQARYLHFLVEEDVKDEPEYMSQNKAFKRFGRANVEKWAKLRQVEIYDRANGRIDYKRSELLKAASNPQDYLITKPISQRGRAKKH